MVGKNTRDIKHTESWRSSSFGPRNIGTGHKYTPSKDSVKTDESALSQDVNRVTTPERAYARQQYEGNLDSLLDSWYEHPTDPTLLRHMYDTGMIVRVGSQIHTHSFMNNWAERKRIKYEDLGDALGASYYQLDPRLYPEDIAHATDLLGRNDIYNKPFDSGILYYPNEYKRMNSMNNIGQHAPIEGKESYASEPLIKDAPSQSSTIHMGNPYHPYKESSPYAEAYYRTIVPTDPKYNNIITAHQWRDNPGEMYTPDSIWQDRFDLPEIPKKPFNWRALVAGGATAAGLTGLGLLAAADYNNRQFEVQTPNQVEPETQPEPTSEQEYVTQSIPSFNEKTDNLFDLYQEQEQLAKDKAAYEAYLRALEMGQRIATGTGYAPELKEGNFVFPQNPPEVGSNIKTAGLESPDGGEVPRELGKLSGVKPKVIKDTSNGPVVLNDPNHRTTRNTQSNSATPEQAAASQMVNQYTGIPVEVIRAKNSGYAQPPLNHATDAIWDRVRKAGLSSPEQAIRSGLFTPDEVRYITENDLWRYR